MFRLLRSPIIVARVPVAKNEGDNFCLEISRNDKTHIQIHAKEWWENLFSKFGYIKKVDILKENIYDSEGVLARVYEKN